MATFTSECNVTHMNGVTVIKIAEGEIGVPGGVSVIPGHVTKLRMDTSRFNDVTIVRNRASFQSQCIPNHAELFWFDHLHIIPTSFALGTVLTTQEREYEVYNGYRTESHQITAITQTAVDGMTLIGDPVNSPRLLGPKSGFVVAVSIDSAGPVAIAAQVDYVFGVLGVTKTVTFTGTRVIIASTEPQSNIVETWEWLTDVIQAASGDEVRISVRDVPRQSFKYEFIKTDEGAQALINRLWAWHENIWGVPIWTDYTTLSADIAAGVTSIACDDLTNRDFRDDTLALIWTDEDNFEAVEISSFGATIITALRVTLKAHSAGALVIPLHLAKLRSDWRAVNHNVNARQVTVNFQMLHNRDFSTVLSPDPRFDGGTYRGLPVLDIASADYLITGGTYNESEHKQIHVFQDNIGKFNTFSNRDFPQNTVSGFQMEAFGRDEFWRLRALTHAMRGKQKSIWITSGRQDFTIESTTTTGAAEIKVNPVGYTDLVMNAPDGPKTRRNIEIVYIDGTREFFRVTTAVATAGVREVLTLDSTLGQDASLANVERISYLIKRRQITDRAEFAHQFYEGDVVLGGRGFVDIYDGE